jgi:hypothetical protein
MAIELNYLASTTLVKVAILVFYRRMTGMLKNAFVYSVWGMIAFCVVPSIIFAFLIIFTCSPVEGFFRFFDMSWRLKNELKCGNEGAIIVACAIVGTMQDFIVCLLPIALVWNLKMSTRQKAALCGIFGVGMITCVCGILRTYYATYVYYCESNPVMHGVSLILLMCTRHIRHHLVCILRLDLDRARSRSQCNVRQCSGSESLLQALLHYIDNEQQLLEIRHQQNTHTAVAVARSTIRTLDDYIARRAQWST